VSTWTIGARPVARQDQVRSGLLDVLPNLTSQTDSETEKIDHLKTSILILRFKKSRTTYIFGKYLGDITIFRII
jgi:hypothetical protein